MKYLGHLMFLLVSAGYVTCDLARVVDIAAGERPDCSCAYHKGGCVISVPAPKDFKCKCKYMGFWTCTGKAYHCVGKEKCPGNRADYCACKLGGGGCGGYVEPLDKTCEISAIAPPDVSPMADCYCQHVAGGCVIHQPAPLGWRCVCIRMSLWSCEGWAQQCAVNEVCLGGDFSYCGCKNGGGTCGGYPDKPECPSPFFSQTCNCDEASEWISGLYTIDRVDYDSKNFSIQSLQPITLSQKDIPNYSGSIQTISIKVAERLTRTSSYTYTSGVKISAGIGFLVGVPTYPVAGGVGGGISVTESYSHEWGKSESTEKMFEGTFTCNGAGHRFTRCSITMEKARINVPYVMQVRHKIIPSCVCESKGVWSGIQAYNAKLFAKDEGNCYSSDCARQISSQYLQD